ncbi:MAG TPA: hypothetical protein VKZ94_16505 [Advenella sp.]|nr:hypothetical protein [Advenella sp.]
MADAVDSRGSNGYCRAMAASAPWLAIGCYFGVADADAPNYMDDNNEKDRS